MKKVVSICIAIALCFCMLPLFSASYDNNEFQRKSRMYTRMAQTAYDEGEYEASVEYAVLAEENALLSEQFIEQAMAKADAQSLLYKAHTRLNWARDKKADLYFPGAYQVAAEAVFLADESFASNDFSETKRLAQKALDSLSVVKEVVPLPEYYRVEYWTTTKDCLWNIAQSPAVYNDPWLWEKLYEANKAILPNPNNPDLIKPGMMIKIPSLKDEYREGVFDPKIKYEPIN